MSASQQPPQGVPQVPSSLPVSSFMEDVQHARLARVARIYHGSSTEPVAAPAAAPRPTRKSKATQPPSPMAELATHLASQWMTHQQVQVRTNALFDKLLTELDGVCGDLRQQLSKAMRRTSVSKLAPLHDGLPVNAMIDGDRSLGMVQVLWHRMSFTVRSQTRPYAIVCPTTHQQVLCGRIMALRGDFVELTEDNPFHDVPDLLHHEVASLYVPMEGPCLVGFAGMDTPMPVDEAMAVRQFAQHCLLMVCTGDLLHEQIDDGDDTI